MCELAEYGARSHENTRPASKGTCVASGPHYPEPAPKPASGGIREATRTQQQVSILAAMPLHFGPRLEHLPLATLYLTERCNSRCITCDYWRHGRADMSLESVTRLLPSLARLETRLVLLSGGEPLLNPEWESIAQLLKANGLQLWLLTSGLSLAKHAHRAGQLFQAITVSLDGTDRETYAAIRGLDAFENVCCGIRAAAATGVPVGVRVTVQRANYQQLPAFIDLARQAGARQVSFLAVDVASPHAFGRTDDFSADLALRHEDLPILEQILCAVERDYTDAFRSGFIAESPRRLRHIYQYFSAVCGVAAFPPVRCNAPEFSAVIGSQGHVSPCFFIAGPPDASGRKDLEKSLNSDSMLGLRQDIRRGARPECRRCVCSLWREPGARISDFLSHQNENA
jgi:MoaA/NifB/PqqE/SkfB family radical SAM enzyme